MRHAEASPPACLLDVNALLTETASLFRYQMRTKGITPVVLPAEEALPLRGDLFLLQRALYIVMLNAVQLLVDSEGEKKVTLSSGAEGERIRIDVLVSIPGPRVTMENGSREPGNEKVMGVGWYTLRKCISAGGRVKVTAGPNLITEMLGYLGFEAALAGDPAAAIPILTERRFDLIMVDYQMPKMQGDAFIRKYISLLKDSYVVLMTGDSSLSLPQIVGARRLSLLRKPFGLNDPSRLAEEVAAGPRPDTC